MPRTIPSTVVALLGAKYAIEPIIIVEVDWVNNQNPHYYSDRKLSWTEGKLLDVSTVESVLNLEGSSTTTSLSVKIDDSDSVIKNIFNYNDVHNRPVKVYQWFDGTPENDKILLLSGVISTPITWSEDERSLSFDVVTELDDREVGFSVEEGDFINVPEHLIGKSWPMPFGTVINMPTLQLDEIPSGSIRIPIGIPDKSLKGQIQHLDTKISELLSKASCLSSNGAKLQLIGRSPYNPSIIERGNALQQQADDMRRQANQNANRQRQRLSTIKTDQDKYDVDVIPVINGSNFRQNVTVTLNINGATYTGIFQGDNFLVSSRRPPDDTVDREPKTERIVNPNELIGGSQEDFDQQHADSVSNSGQIFRTTSEAILARNQGDPCVPPWFYIWSTFKPQNQYPEKEGQFFFANAGSAVTIKGNYPIRYIISIIPGIQVISLAAKNNVGGFKVLTIIPPSHYTISTLQFGPIAATIATFNQPLSTIEGQSWENEVYATVVSPIGPNVVDILTYLIQTYTSFSIDSTSFNYVRTKLQNYPANFALLDRVNVVTLLKDIAFQARCALWITNRKFYIKYLPEQGTVIDSLNESDIELTTLSVTTTDSEDIVTKMIAEWKQDYSKEENNRVIMRYNISKYGVRERSFNFYIYNHIDLVIKAATFWLIRYANVWKKLNCKALLHKLKIETLDTVQLNFSHNYIADVPVNSIVDKATYDSNNYTITMDIWTPVRLGEMTPYPFAYPANIDTTAIFPTDEDIAAGVVGDVHSEAEGDLGAIFNTTNISYSRGTIRTRPADANETSPPQLPTIQTVNPYTIPGLTDTSFEPNERPRYDYQYRPVETPQREINPNIDSPIPGKVKGKVSDNQYTVEIYPFGLNNIESVQEVTAKVLQLDPNETIPEDTWVHVFTSIWHRNNEPVTEYTIQPPIFIGEAS